MRKSKEEKIQEVLDRLDKKPTIEEIWATLSVALNQIQEAAFKAFKAEFKTRIKHANEKEN